MIFCVQFIAVFFKHLAVSYFGLINSVCTCTGWGRGLRRAVGSWYLSWEPRRLALEVTRHASAHGWTHRDVLKLAHLKLKDMPIGNVLLFCRHFIDVCVCNSNGKS